MRMVGKKRLYAAYSEKRFDPMTAEETEKQRIYGYLARKGFKYETVRQVIQNYEDNA